MTHAEMARLHAVCFTVPRPWAADEMASVLANPFCFVVTEIHGFLIGRVVAGEAELLTVAVDPLARRQGTGARLVAGFIAKSQERGANRVFLEVAEANIAARALYASHGFADAGRRRGYYKLPDGTLEDALVLAQDLPPNPDQMIKI